VQKQAPSIGRILVAIGFALSCFGLILFLWIAFGGPIPLKPTSYEITAYFPEATQLATESDVRIGGVSVGKVKSIQLAPEDKRVNGQDTTQATIEIDPQFAPINSDARAILRQKTLLGETYVELTAGNKPGTPVSLGSSGGGSSEETQNVHAIAEGGTLGVGQTKDATQIDEIFNALDKQTRTAFQKWQASAAVAINGRSVDLNDSLGNLGPFLGDATNVLHVLRSQRTALQGLVRDTGTVFNALSERNQELSGAITNSNQAFAALANQNKALAETFQILPVFEHESHLTLQRLDSFQANTRPLIQKLLPVANDISPTLRSVRELSPHLKSLFINLMPLIKASQKGLPATKSVLTGLRPVLSALDPFLASLNPVIKYLGFYRSEITGFLTGPPAALGDTLALSTNKPMCSKTGGTPPSCLPAPMHALRQLGYTSPESLSVFPTRLSTNRGNGYPQPNALAGYQAVKHGIFPNFDCKPSGGEINNKPPDPANANCFVAPKFPDTFGGGQAPNLYAEP
jgi:phospholipid/cholesterol/gamma-HCH transport system substrate-binding protein